MAQHRNELAEENESLKQQICELKSRLSYNKHMFDYAWQLLLSYSQWYKIPQCLTGYFTSGYKISGYPGWLPGAHMRLPVVNLNSARKTSLLTSMYATAYLNHTYDSQWNPYDWHGYRRPNREFPLRELEPYHSSVSEINDDVDSEIDDDDNIILDMVD
jgi:hypothetical protein